MNDVKIFELYIPSIEYPIIGVKILEKTIDLLLLNLLTKSNLIKMFRVPST